MGSYVDQFERKVCEYTGARYAAACVNGTASLHIALLTAGVEPGDEVLVPSLTFIATVNAVRYVNADPIFLGSDSFFTLDPQIVLDFLNTYTNFKNGVCINRQTGKRISAIVPVHVLGNAADLGTVLEACSERNISIIEDAAESLGTFYTSGPLAPAHTGTLGHVGIYSFNGNKIITSGGGGMVVTNDPELARRARYLTNQAKEPGEQYVHEEVGYNYRLTNIQAALGLAQLEVLPEFIECKRRTYRAYQEAVDPISGLEVAAQPDFASNNSWMTAIRVDASVYGLDAFELMKKLAERNIQTRPLWVPNHLQKPYRTCQTFGVDASEQSWQEVLNLPCSADLSDQQQQRVIEELRDVGQQR